MLFNLGVACLLVEANVSDLNVLMAAILHDTVEDTDTSFDELEEHFGKAVRDIVDECTDDKTKPKQMRKILQIRHAKKISREAKLVKLADKLYNLRDLERCTPVGWSKVYIDSKLINIRKAYRWKKNHLYQLKHTQQQPKTPILKKKKIYLLGAAL